MEKMDWQDPAVTEALIPKMTKACEEWTQDRGLTGRPIGTDLGHALTYAGESADAYQMARYLEEHHYWPSDQRLVCILELTAHWREEIIQDLSRPKPLTDDEFRAMDEFPRGTEFSHTYEHDRSSHYRITGIRTRHPLVYELLELNTLDDAIVSHENLVKKATFHSFKMPMEGYNDDF